MIVTATQIKVESIIGFLRFIRRVRHVREQLGTADGLVFVKFNGLCTLTGWKSRDAMKAFRNSGRHLDAMRNISSIGKAKSISWEVQSEPDWHEAKEKLDRISV
jgi:heme-degrading monooxygenase HmoA